MKIKTSKSHSEIRWPLPDSILISLVVFTLLLLLNEWMNQRAHTILILNPHSTSVLNVKSNPSLMNGEPFKTWITWTIYIFRLSNWSVWYSKKKRKRIKSNSIKSYEFTMSRFFEAIAPLIPTLIFVFFYIYEKMDKNGQNCQKLPNISQK